MTEDERKRILEEAKAHATNTWRAEDYPPAPVAKPPIEKSDVVDGLTRKVTENAQLPGAEALQPATNDDAWNAWLQRAIDMRLEEERAEWTEILGEVVAKLRSEYQRDTDRDAEINHEFVKIWKSVEAATRSIVELRREKVEQSFREVGSDSTKKMS
jgi:hypothetical protein